MANYVTMTSDKKKMKMFIMVLTLLLAAGPVFAFDSDFQFTSLLPFAFIVFVVASVVYTLVRLVKWAYRFICKMFYRTDLIEKDK